MTRCSIRLTWLALFALIAMAPRAATAEKPPAGPRTPRLTVQLGQWGSPFSVAFSPDGRYVATGGNDSTACVWETATGNQLLRVEFGKYYIAGIAFSPDSKRLLLASNGHSDGCLWDLESGKEVQRFKGHRQFLNAVAFSPDGKRVLTAGFDGARLWDAASGQELLKIVENSAVLCAAFSPNGKELLTGTVLWEAETGKRIREFSGHKGGVWAVAFSADGSQIVTGSDDYTVGVWDKASGKLLHHYKGHKSTFPLGIRSVAISPDGKHVLSSCGGDGARLWETATGKEIRAFGWVEPVSISRDGKLIAAGTALFDFATGKHVRSFHGHTSRILSLLDAPEGDRLVTVSGRVAVWDLRTGSIARSFTDVPDIEPTASLSRDGKQLMLGGTKVVFQSRTAGLRDVVTGTEKPLSPHKDGWSYAVEAISPDGKWVLAGSKREGIKSLDTLAYLLDAATFKVVRQYEGHTLAVTRAAFSPDSKQVLTVSIDRTARLWDRETGKQLHAFQSERPGQGNPFSAAHAGFTPDGARIVTFEREYTQERRDVIHVWDAKTGKELLHFHSDQAPVHSWAISVDGAKLLTTRENFGLLLWDLATGKELRRFPFRDYVLAVAFVPNSNKALVAHSDTTTQVLDLDSGESVCRLIQFHDGGWAVVDSAGRYDASNGGEVTGLHWVVGVEVIALKQLKERYYDPGLLAKHLGFSKEPLRDVADFTNVELYPEVGVAQANPDKPQIDVTLTNRGGGIGRVVVLVNRKELTADARPRGSNPDAETLTVQLDLTNDPRLVPGKKNTVEVFAYNGAGYLSSRGLVRLVDAPGTTPVERPTLHAIVVGVSKYRGDKLNLRYAAKDAEDFASALRLAANRLFGVDKVNLTLLTRVETEQRPSRANLVKAFESLKTTRPGDIVVVYLAGHGVTQGGQDGDWHFLTADAQSAELTDPEVRKANSVSSAELTELLKTIPAQKQVLILDTCHSGRVVEKLTEKREVPGSQIRALERVKDRTGMHVLAGCAADSVSYEASRYGQGILTYSLLLGMRLKLREGEYVDVVDLFSFAADKVPELARDIGGVQRPTIASPHGASFDIGRLTADDRSKVPLQAVKPVVLRSVFQLEKPARDSLGLSKRVNDRLRETSAAVRGATLVYVDADELPGGVQVSGRYKVEGDNVTVNISLFEADTELAAFPVDGSAGKPDELAAKIVAEVEKRLGAKAP